MEFFHAQNKQEITRKYFAAHHGLLPVAEFLHKEAIETKEIVACGVTAEHAVGRYKISKQTLTNFQPQAFSSMG